MAKFMLQQNNFEMKKVAVQMVNECLLSTGNCFFLRAKEPYVKHYIMYVFCPTGHGGENCNIEYNECQSSPCRNNGFCVDKEDGWECHCGMGYTGMDCSLKARTLISKPGFSSNTTTLLLI